MKKALIILLILLAGYAVGDGSITEDGYISFNTDYFQSDELNASDPKLITGNIDGSVSFVYSAAGGCVGHRVTRYDMTLNLTTRTCDGMNYFCETIPSGQQMYYVWADDDPLNSLMSASTAEWSGGSCTNLSQNQTEYFYTVTTPICVNTTEYNSTTPVLHIEVSNYQTVNPALLNQSYFKGLFILTPRTYADNGAYIAQRYAPTDVSNFALGCGASTTTTTTTTLPNACTQEIQVNYENGSGVNGATVKLIGPSIDPTDNILQTNDSGYAYFNDLVCGQYDVWAEYVPITGDQYPFAKYNTIDCYRPNELVEVTLQRFIDKFYFNATFNIFDYGKLNMAGNNKVSLFACDSSSNCVVRGYDALRMQCDLLGENTTSHEGIMHFYNKATLKRHLCGMSRYLHIDSPVPPQVSLWPTENMLGYYNINFNFTYGIDVQEYEVCIGFLDSLTRLPLTGVNVSIADARNILDLEKSGTISGQYHCWNTSQIEDDGTTATKILTAFKTNYFPIRFQLITPRVGNNNFPLTPLPHNVTSAYKYFMEGHTVDTGMDGVADLHYTATCTDPNNAFYTTRNKSDSTGYYKVSNIVDGSSCSIRVTDSGYDSTSVERTVGGNLTGLNITVTLKSGDLTDVDFSIVKEGIYLGSFDPVPNALFIITCPGYYTKGPVLTDREGHVIIKDLRRDCDHNYMVTADGFLVTPGTFKPTTNTHTIVMQDESGTCVIEGYTYNNTVGNGLPADMTLLRDGNVVSTLTSSQFGYYRFQVECGVQHSIRAQYEDEVQTENFRVQETEEGNSISQNFIFEEAEITWKEDINEFTAFLRLMMPLFYIGAFMFVTLMIYLLAKKFGGPNFITEIIVVVIVILSVVVIATLLELVAFLLETLG